MKHDERMIVGLMGCSHAVNHGYMLIFPAVLLLLQKEFSLGYLGLGVIGSVMNFTYGLGAFPGGLIYNRLGPKKLYLLCFLGSAVASILVATSSSLTLLTAGLALLGLFSSVYHPLSNVLISAKVEQYGRALGIHGAAGNIGVAGAPFMAGIIASYLGWRYAYLWFALSGMGLSVYALFIDMSSSEAEETPPPMSPAKTSLSGSLKVYFSLPLVLLYLANMMHSFCYQGAMIFLPTYLAKRTSFHLFSLDTVAMGGILSAIVLFMGAFGQYGGGLLSQGSRLEKRFLIISIILFPFILAMSFTTDLPLLTAALVYFFFHFFLQPMSNALLVRYTAPWLRGTAFGLFFSIAFGFASLASSFAGYIAQQFALHWVFMGLSSSVLLLIVVAFLLQEVKISTDGFGR
jgi:MFS transporter, FSR family, fosmidomycin resistance protein